MKDIITTNQMLVKIQLFCQTTILCLMDKYE